MKYRLIYTTKFKKDYKLSIKRGMPIELLKDTITLTLSRTGSHSDIFK